MPIDNNYLLLALCAVVGAGWKSIAGWMKTVNVKLDELRDQKTTCLLTFVSKEEFEQSKDHVWAKLREHDQLLLKLMAANPKCARIAGDDR